MCVCLHVSSNCVIYKLHLPVYFLKNKVNTKFSSFKCNENIQRESMGHIVLCNYRPSLRLILVSYIIYIKSNLTTSKNLYVNVKIRQILKEVKGKKRIK